MLHGGFLRGFLDAVVGGGGVMWCRKKKPEYSFPFLYGMRLVAAIARIHLLFFEKPRSVPFVEKVGASPSQWKMALTSPNPPIFLKITGEGVLGMFSDF